MICPQSGKLGYQSHAEAMRVANRVARRDPRRDRMQTYHCQVCGLIHIGHDTRRPARVAKRKEKLRRAYARYAAMERRDQEVQYS